MPAGVADAETWSPTTGRNYAGVRLCRQCGGGSLHNFGGVVRCGTCGRPAELHPEPAAPPAEERRPPKKAGKRHD